MKVLHVIPSLSPSQGGPSFALPMMARALRDAGVEVDIATTDDDGPGKHTKMPLGMRLERDGIGYFYFSKQTEFYKGSWPLYRWLKQHVSDYDLVHVHALFSFASGAAARTARAAAVPYIIRPLGVLNRWGMENRRRWLKSLSFRLVEQPLINGAAAIHYTSEQEKAEAEASGVRAVAAMIPLGIDVEEFAVVSDSDLPGGGSPESNAHPQILFLSRLDPKKGVELLLAAFACVSKRFPNGRLVIAGSGQPAYIASLKAKAVQLGIANEVIWPGFLSGREKLSALSAASVFCLPSYSENFGIAAVEALAAGLPVILTKGVAIAAEVETYQAGLVVEPSVGALAAALDRVLSEPDLCSALGRNARRLTVERYSLAAMGKSLQGLYLKIL
ncbi:MAG: hypothetical protein JWL59_551 [Chthoniobacteraceae bacterium]|nr:hypothetical protein [Chthoniobacteraceae bacterium]